MKRFIFAITLSHDTDRIKRLIDFMYYKYFNNVLYEYTCAHIMDKIVKIK